MKNPAISSFCWKYRTVVLMTNVLDAAKFLSPEFGVRYHQRWRIKEAFKRLKYRLNLEQV
jgi:IS4 transposase